MDRQTRDELLMTLGELRGTVRAIELKREHERERAYRHPINQLCRAAHGFWRSVVTGGWE